ncbi:polycomb group protein Psc [Anopheles nili]|uniref:polycomb group protein Psc n=1 Tax=Anopheles nili TaxID=185578 RepID=UPI00237BCFCE|nr:polycomb group protein Psc [Anopheles nili]
MVLLPPTTDVLRGGGALSVNTEITTEGTPPLKVPVPPPSMTLETKPPMISIVATATTTTPLTVSDVSAGTAASMLSAGGPLSPYRPSRVTLESVYPCITCNLCKGYLIDATTIVECLHSFCHSCIMKHLRTEQYCPQCEMMINKAKPNIKPDATLQAIVYKLVPGLYENELLQRRAFYRLHPEMAAFATPEQRGENTEYLIFSPSEKISLSLEYAEKELAEESEELLKAKYLLCPAVFSIALLKKFIIYKYGISERQFCVEIMYKVKTITLPDYYTLMDVAYIYTWKRDAPMKFYYRIRTTESNPVELPEVPLRRSPSLVTTGKQRSTTDEDEEDDKENVRDLARVGSEVVTLPSESDGNTSSSSSCCSSSTTNRRRLEETQPAEVATKSLPQDTLAVSPATPARKNESIKLKIGLNKNKYVSILASPQSDVPSNAGATASPGVGRPHKSQKAKRKRALAAAAAAAAGGALHQIEGNPRQLKIKIEKIKDVGLVSSSMSKREAKNAKKQHQLAMAAAAASAATGGAPYKVELSPGVRESSQDHERDSKRLHGSSKGSSSTPSSGKVKVKSPKSGKSSNSSGGTSSPEDVKHPIVLKIDQRSPDMATSTLKFGMPRKPAVVDKSSTPPPLPPSPPAAPAEVKKFTDEKSMFLNSFDLAPIKTEVSSEEASRQDRNSPPSGTVSPPTTTTTTTTAHSSTPPSTPPTTTTVAPSPTSGGQMKRKAKDTAGGTSRSASKKPKLSDDEMKAIVEKKVAENIRSPSEHLAPPMFIIPKVPPTGNATITPSGAGPAGGRQLSPPLQGNPNPPSVPSPPVSYPNRDSPRPFAFKTPAPPAPPPPPPPIVSASNIPAVKPSQQVLPAPIPQKPIVASQPAPAGASPKPRPSPPTVAQSVAGPVRRPTAPSKLPTSSTNSSQVQLNGGSGATTHSVPAGGGLNRLQKPLELKSAQSNPSINILPPPATSPPASIPTSILVHDTEISKLRPEDLKKNVKVYGPPTSVASVVEQQQSSKPGSGKPDGISFAVPQKMAPKSSSTAVATTGTGSAPTKPTTGGSATVQGVKARPVNYLNYAIFNTKAAAAGSRTPIPSYSTSSSSPSYSPDSPQYSPNLSNIGSKPFKYANPLAYNSHLQNMLNDRKTGPPSPPTSTITTIPVSSPSPPQQSVSPPAAPALARKRPASALSPDGPKSPESQPPAEKAAALLQQIQDPQIMSKIPSALTVSLSTAEEDMARQIARKRHEIDPKNNFIEILKLPEVPITEVKVTLSVMPPTTSNSVTTTIASAGSASSSPQDRRSSMAMKVTSALSGGVTMSTGQQQQQQQQLGGKPATAPLSTASVTSAIGGRGPSGVGASVPSSKAPASLPVSTNAATGTFQRKYMEAMVDKSMETKTPTPTTTGKQQPIKPPVVSRVSTTKAPTAANASTAATPTNSKFKLPNATVREDGSIKLNNYREVDLILKNIHSQKPAPVPAIGAATQNRMLPPQTPSTKVPSTTSPSASSVPITSRPIAINGRMTGPSQPINRPSAPTHSASSLGKAKTTTSPASSPASTTHMPSMASMGPMFDIQMKSDAIAATSGAVGGTPTKKTCPVSSTTGSGSSVGSLGTVPRRKYAPTNNSASLVPLVKPTPAPKITAAAVIAAAVAAAAASSSPSSPSPSPSPSSVSTASGPKGQLGASYADFITLHPQGSTTRHTQQSAAVAASVSAPISASVSAAASSYQNQNYSLNLVNDDYFSRQLAQNSLSHLYPVIMQQYMQRAAAGGIGPDSVTITASSIGTGRNSVSQNSLTVTAIPPGTSRAGASGRVGGAAGPNVSGPGGPRSGGAGSAGLNPATSRNNAS